MNDAERLDEAGTKEMKKGAFAANEQSREPFRIRIVLPRYSRTG